MKITIERSTFADTLGWILRSVSTRATLPALGGVLFDASGPSLRLAGTDLELAGEATVEAKIDAPGQVVLPGRVLGEIARALPDGAVHIDASSGQQAKITCGQSAFTLRTLPVEDFPTLSTPSGPPSGTIDAATFATAVGQVTRAASADEARPVLTGTLVDATEASVTLVATDSYRLAVRTIGWKGPKEGVRRVIPARALAEAARAAEDGDVEISLGESQASFTTGTRTLTTRLIEGEFPNWSQLIPKELPNELRLERETLIEAVRRVGILAQSGTAVRFDIGSDGAKLAAGSADVGDATEQVEGKFEGEPLEVAFNPSYLLDGLNAVEGPEVVLAVRDGLKPGVVRAPEDEDGFLYLVMPVRI